METKSPALLQQLHPKLWAAALSAWILACKATPENVHPQIIQSLRGFAESDHDYALGRTIVNLDGKSEKKPMGNIISYAKGGQSYHNYGLAFDLVMMVDGKEDWEPNMTVVNIFKNHGLAWGGDWLGKKRDTPHFENRLGYNWRALQKLYNQKHFIPGSNYLNI